jgi:hypothetical protein
MNKIRGCVLVLIFITSVAVELTLEELHLVDSIGMWYTLLVATVYTVLVSVVLFALTTLVKASRRNGSGPK